MNITEANDFQALLRYLLVDRSLDGWTQARPAVKRLADGAVERLRTGMDGRHAAAAFNLLRDQLPAMCRVCGCTWESGCEDDCVLGPDCLCSRCESNRAVTLHAEPSPLAGRAVEYALKRLSGVTYLQFTVVDWWDRIFGESWRASDLTAARRYADHRAIAGLPLDDEVLYGAVAYEGVEIDSFVAHVTELRETEGAK